MMALPGDANTRRLLSVALAVVVTFSLFYLMHALSFLRAQPQQDEAGLSANLNFLLEDEDSAVRRRDRRPERVQQHKPPPPPPLQLAASRPDLGALGGVAVGIPTGELGFGGDALSDMDAVPLVRIEPEYPRRAAQLNLKGWVHLRFTVTTLGTVRDVSVVDSEPPRTFDRAATRAVQKFKYRPKVVDGQPVEQYGVEIVITFDGVEEE